MKTIDEEFKAMTPDERREYRTKLFWKRIDRILADKGITLKDVAEQAGLKYSTVISWRANGRLPDLSSALDIAEVLGVFLENIASPLEYPQIKAVDILSDASALVPEELKSSQRFMNNLKHIEESAVIFDELVTSIKDSAGWAKAEDFEALEKE